MKEKKKQIFIAMLELEFKMIFMAMDLQLIFMN